MKFDFLYSVERPKIGSRNFKFWDHPWNCPDVVDISLYSASNNSSYDILYFEEKSLQLNAIQVVQDWKYFFGERRMLKLTQLAGVIDPIRLISIDYLSNKELFKG